MFSRYLVIILLALLARATAGGAEPLWFERSWVGMEVGPTGAQFGGHEQDLGYAKNFDGREIVRASLKAHAQYLVIWARDGAFTYYDSQVQPKAPGLGDRDVLRETLAEAKTQGMPVIAYCVLQYPSYHLEKNPDWKMRDSKGQPIHHLVCFNSPYTNVVEALLREMLDYGVDGFHLDMVDQGFGPPHGCWCERCQALFQAQFGRAMPKDISWDEDWDRMLEFRYQTSERFEHVVRDYVRKLSSAATVDFNYHGTPPFSWEVGQRPVQHATNADFVTGETGQWGFSALGVGLNAEFYRAATPGRPYQVAIQRGVRMYHDQTTRPLADIRWELFTLLAHGAFVTMVDKTGYDGWLDPLAYERIGQAFGEAREKSEHFGQAPIYDLGLYFSARTRDWYGREDPPSYFRSVQGAHKACAYGHLMFGVLFDESLSLERLEAFPVVCLPNAAILSPREVGLFRGFVEEGGCLLVTGQSGLYDALGRPRTSSVLTELIGAKVVRRLETIDNWVRLDEASMMGAEGLARDIPLGWPFLVKGPAVVYEPGAARPIGELLAPHRSVLQKESRENSDWPMSADQPVGPAFLINQVGRGKVLTCAASPDYSAASQHHITEARYLFRNAVRWLRPAPRVEVQAPGNVESVVTDDPVGRKLRIHLIAYQALPQTTSAKERPLVLPGLMEAAPLYRATIECRDSWVSAKALSPATQLDRAGRRIDLLVNDVHEAIVIEY